MGIFSRNNSLEFVVDCELLEENIYISLLVSFVFRIYTCSMTRLFREFIAYRCLKRDSFSRKLFKLVFMIKVFHVGIPFVQIEAYLRKMIVSFIMEMNYDEKVSRKKYNRYLKFSLDGL